MLAPLCNTFFIQHIHTHTQEKHHEDKTRKDNNNKYQFSVFLYFSP